MNIKFKHDTDLIPVIIQNYVTQQVLMLGYMNEDAYHKTVAEKVVTFYSRSKKRLWTKGQTSGNFLQVKNIAIDCDADTILIQAVPLGIVCHSGSATCFGAEGIKGFLYTLEATIKNRIDDDQNNSYSNTLYKKGINKIAQKVGEEAVELIIEAKDNDLTLFKNEAADLLYHFLILLKAKGTQLTAVEEVLKARAS